MKKSDSIILKSYNKYKTVRGVAEETGYSWNKIVKSLSSNGIVINDTHRLILNMWISGKDVDDISNATRLSVKTIKSYLPRVRPVYGEDLSKNAEKIKKFRERRQSENGN